MPVPTTLVTGGLGVGKTTAILAALRARPPGEKWAVLVNEFGTVGIDGPLLADAGGLAVREIAGGCICCTANVPLRVALVRLLREVEPDRLFVEPTGLAHPASIIDVVRSPGIREAITLRATITLVEPARFLRGGDDLLADQVQAADVLVGNFADRTADEVLARFRAAAAKLDPGPLVVATTSFAELDPSWLDLDPAPKAVRIFHPPAETDAHELGWIWPPADQFGLDALQRVLQRLVRPGGELPDGVLRLKGIFHTERGFLSVHASPDAITFAPIGWRRDSRVTLITAAPILAPEAVAAAFASSGTHQLKGGSAP